MASHMDRVMQAEILGEDIITDKAQLVTFDKRRQANREALRALKDNNKSQTVWYCSGDMFIKLPASKTREIIEEDQKTLEKEIANMQKGLKLKIKKLEELEGGLEASKPFFLEPVDISELGLDKVPKKR